MHNGQDSALKRLIDELTQEIRTISNFLPTETISWRMYWYSIPISLITAVVFLPSHITLSMDLAKWALVGLVSHASMAPFVHYAKNRKERSIQILLSFLMGAVRGAVISTLAPILGIVDSVSLPIRVFNSAIAVFYWMQILAIFLQIRSVYKIKLQELLRRAIYEVDATKNSDFANTPTSEYEEIIELIESLKTSISADIGGPLSLKQQIDSIDELINDHIKPQSVKRWEHSELVWPRIPIRLMLRDSLISSRVPVFTTTLLTFPFSIVGAIVRNGFWFGLLAELIFTILAFCTYFIVRLLITSKDSYLRFNLYFIGLAMIAIYPLVDLFFAFVFPDYWRKASNSFAVQALSMLLYVIILLAANVLFLHQRARNTALDNLEGVLSKSQVKDFLLQGSAAKTQADLAQYLHAEVQAQLHACKLLLLKAAESDFQLFSPQVTTMVVKRLESLQAPYARVLPKIPSARVQEIVDAWAGLSTITYSLPPQLNVTSANGEVIAQLIEEGVVNSIRHGKAKIISIEGRIVDGYCHITINNDGGLVASTHKGLGTMLFDTFADKWEIHSDKGSTQLTFSLPLPETEMGPE